MHTLYCDTHIQVDQINAIFEELLVQAETLQCKFIATFDALEEGTIYPSLVLLPLAQSIIDPDNFISFTNNALSILPP